MSGWREMEIGDEQPTSRWRTIFSRRRVTIAVALLTITLLMVIALYLKAQNLETTDKAKHGSKIMAEYCNTNLQTMDAELTKLKTLKVPKSGGDSQNKIAAIAWLDQYNKLYRKRINTMSKADLFSSVHPDEMVRQDSDNCLSSLRKFWAGVTVDKGLYGEIANVNSTMLEAKEAYLLKLIKKDFKDNGASLNDEDTKKFKELVDKETKLANEFRSGIQEDTRSILVDHLDGLPADFVKSHVPKGGKITITTNYDDYQPFMTYANNTEDRKRLYVEYLNRGYPANVQHLEELIKVRHDIATLLGFKTYAHYVIEPMMMDSPEAAQTFIDQIHTAVVNRTKSDREPPPGGTGPVLPYESSFYGEKVRKTTADFDSKSVRPYFPYTTVRDGVFSVTSAMFGISIVNVTASDSERWHESVEAWEILGSNKQSLGRFYLDMHPRENKYKHAAMFGLVAGDAENLPSAALVCNFPGGGKVEDSLMEHHQVETFFHEFGHLLHHIFGGTGQKWVAFSGVATEQDFVEAPSQMLEEWVWDPNTLQKFSSHYQTGEAIPHDLTLKMRQASKFGRGMWVSQQMFYAAVSLNFYNREPNFKTDTLMQELQAKYSPHQYVEDTHFQASFGHLEGYSAVYYTYMWDLVIAKDMFQKFEASGNLLDPTVATQYREKVIGQGGSKPAAELVHDFLGRDYNMEAFNKWLQE